MKDIPPPPLDFDTYVVRPDTSWIEREPPDSLTFIYESGYLPYSGAKDLQNVFYSARSARVDLQGFELTSENRRIAKKFDGAFTKERTAGFDYDDSFYSFCLEYFAQKHGANTMPLERLRTIIESGLVSTTTIYRSTDTVVAYVLEIADGNMAHYWFSFYGLAYERQSLGLWLMLDGIRDAKARGLAHYYLGTVYGPKALYKANFEPLEWWDSTTWNRDIPLLKDLCKGD